MAPSSSCRRYDRLPPDARDALRQARLRSLVAHARTASPFYRARYSDLPPDTPLAALPPVTKAELMANFDDWLTDATVTSGALRGYLADRLDRYRTAGGRPGGRPCRPAGFAFLR